MRYLILLIILFSASACARVKMTKLEYGTYKGGYVSFQNEFRVNAKMIKAAKKMFKYCAPLNPMITGGGKDMRFDQGLSFVTARGVAVNMPSSYEEWVTVNFKCVWGDGS